MPDTSPEEGMAGYAWHSQAAPAAVEAHPVRRILLRFRSSTRVLSPRQLPTDHDSAVPTREYQSDQPSLPQPQLLPALLPNEKAGSWQKTSTAGPRQWIPIQ